MLKREQLLDRQTNEHLKELLIEVYECNEPRQADFEAILEELYSRINIESLKASHFRRRSDKAEEMFKQARKLVDELKCLISN